MRKQLRGRKESMVNRRRHGLSAVLVLASLLEGGQAFCPGVVLFQRAKVSAPICVRKSIANTPPRFALRMVSSTAADKQAQDFADITERESDVAKIKGPLKNRYFALRHGQSEANIADIISSDETRGSTIHGLTQEGRRQARESANALLNVIDQDQLQSLVVYSSNFTRARETAEEACAGLKELVANIPVESLVVKIELGLRERWFGELDNTIITNYNKVWPADWKDAQCTHYGVESVDAVCERVGAVIAALESRHDGRDIVLVSHADTLQILQMFMSGADVRRFSAFRFKNGEVRPLLLDDQSALPPPAPLEYKREDDH